MNGIIEILFLLMINWFHVKSPNEKVVKTFYMEPNNYLIIFSAIAETFSEADFEASAEPAFPIVFTSLKTCRVIDWKEWQHEDAITWFMDSLLKPKICLQIIDNAY